MARDESTREDLLREATALVERIELVAARQATTEFGGPETSQATIVVGFRSNGAASFFFGEDAVYQFNAAGELRRAFCDGRLFKAALRRLVSLERVRRLNEVQLLSHELTDDEQSDFMQRMQARLWELARGLESGGFRVVGQVPAEADVLPRVGKWLAAHDGQTIAMTPRV